jgi:hypothetical protein
MTLIDLAIFPAIGGVAGWSGGVHVKGGGFGLHALGGWAALCPLQIHATDGAIGLSIAPGTGPDPSNSIRRL